MYTLPTPKQKLPWQRAASPRAPICPSHPQGMCFHLSHISDPEPYISPLLLLIFGGESCGEGNHLQFWCLKVTPNVLMGSLGARHPTCKACAQPLEPSPHLLFSTQPVSWYQVPWAEYIRATALYLTLPISENIFNIFVLYLHIKDQSHLESTPNAPPTS